MGLLCFKSTLGPSHAIGHQMDSLCDEAHGHTICICLAPTLHYNKEHSDVEFWSVVR